MDLNPYVDGLRRDLAVAAGPAGAEVARAAEVLAGSLDNSARLCLLEALSDAAAEITAKLTAATVDVRLRGRDAQFVVTETPPPPPDRPQPPGVGPNQPIAAGTGEPESADIARITLRLPEWLKQAVERSCAAEGISVNAWLVRAITQTMQGGPAQSPPTGHSRSGRRLTGYAQA
jgi:hypothetical protein